MAPLTLTPLGEMMVRDLPPVFQEDPDVRAIQHVYARESELIQERIEALQRELNPVTATDWGLALWERTLRLPVRPADQALEQRRESVLSVLQGNNLDSSERAWILNVTKIVGPGWTFEEHDPDDPGSPPAYTVRITVPFAPAGDAFARAERLIREVTPAHLDIILTSGSGFILDQSQLDQEQLGF